MGVIAYKGFNKDMTCRGFHYEVGKTYSLPDGEHVKLCEKGFHACENPLDVFRYYAPGESVFCEVEQSGERERGESKQVSSVITIKRSLSIDELCRRGHDFLSQKSSKRKIAGNRGSATAGDRESATVGDNGSAVSGDYGSATAETAKVGDYGIAAARGERPRACGKIGALLVIQLTSKLGDLIAQASGTIDGKSIKSDTWYTLKDGKMVEDEKQEGME